MSSFDDASGAMPPHDGGEHPEPPDGAVFAPEPEPVPTPAASLHETLDRRVVLYWLISALISWTMMAGLGFGALLFLRVQWPESWTLTLTAYLSLVVLYLVWSLLWPTLAYNRWRFAVDHELLLARYGIFFIEEKAIPISRLQHVDLYRGLLERFFGLTTLIVFTAGTEGAHFRLPGLSMTRARDLRDFILAARGDDVI